MYRGGYNGAPENYRNIQPTSASIQSARGNRPVANIPIQHFNNQIPHPLIDQQMYYPAQIPQMPIQQIPQLPRPGLLPPPQLVADNSLPLPRRRRFDQMPAYEKVGGDMDISRSRSGSPKRAHRDRSPLKNFEKIRDGILYSDDNYYNFLVLWVDRFDSERVGHREDKTKKLIDLITKANRVEKDEILLPPEYSKSDRDRLVHCDLTIPILPSSIFFGSGYGTRSTTAKNAAAKDLIDKCNRIGVISHELHAAIGKSYQFDRRKYSKEINKSLESIKLIRRKIEKAGFPRDILTQRQIDPKIIEQFKQLLRSVNNEIYPPDSKQAPPVEKLPQVVKNGPVSAEKLIAIKEEQLKKKFELEMEAKRKQMEEEIRAQIVQEERAKIREELEREKRIEMMLIQQQQYEKEKEMKEREKALLEQQKKELYLQETKNVEDELNRMVVQLENKLLEFKDKGMTSVLELIFSSSAFKTIASMAESSNKMTIEDKKQLTIDLKALLECAALSVNSLTGSRSSNSSSSYQQNQSSSSYGMGDNSTSTSSSYSSYAKQVEEQNHAGFPLKSANDLRSSGQSSSRQNTSSSSSSKPSSSSRPPSSASNQRQQQQTITQQEPVKRVQVGGLSLRSFNSIEQRRLTTGTKVIAQDMKTGNWQVGTIKTISNNRATLAVGNTAWKKDLSDLYTEDDNKF